MHNSTLSLVTTAMESFVSSRNSEGERTAGFFTLVNRSVWLAEHAATRPLSFLLRCLMSTRKEAPIPRVSLAGIPLYDYPPWSAFLRTQFHSIVCNDCHGVFCEQLTVKEATQPTRSCVSLVRDGHAPTWLLRCCRISQTGLRHVVSSLFAS